MFVNAPGRDVAAAKAQNKAERVIVSEQSTLKAFVKEMRVHQYAKNALIFVPLFTSHHYNDLALLVQVLVSQQQS